MIKRPLTPKADITPAKTEQRSMPVTPMQSGPSASNMGASVTGMDSPSRQAAPTRPPLKKRPEGWRSIMSTAFILLLAPVIALFLITFVFQSYQVDGQSMQTTLQDHDRLIIWKLPRTWARIIRHDYVPNRGDVIVFTEAKIADFGQDPKKQLIKRVIGLPGDRVVVANGEVTVYNKEHPEGFNPDKTLPYGTVIQTTNTDTDVTVAAGELFVMGDNRANSLDSRSFGPIQEKNIVGKLVIRILPLNQMKPF